MYEAAVVILSRLKIEQRIDMSACSKRDQFTNRYSVSWEAKVFWARAICFATSGEVLCELKATSSHRRIL